MTETNDNGPTGDGASAARRRGVIWAAALISATLAATLAILSGTSGQEFSDVRSAFRPSDVWIVDRDGYPLESIRTQTDRRSLEWVAWANVSPVFRDLLVQAEDRRFYQHSGVDSLSLGKALWEKMHGRSRGGASTLTMQLVGMLDPGMGQAGRRSILSKFYQLLAALRLELTWTKDEILEAYINLAPFRGEVVGLQAASLGYVAKPPSGLTRPEAAVLIALLRSPNAAAAVVAARACRILENDGCARVDELAERILTRPYDLPRARTVVPVLAERVIESGRDASLIRTSLSRDLQVAALAALREQLASLVRQNAHDGAVLVVEAATGRVAAYIANAGAGVASAEQVDGVQMRRQAGSTIKPFVYAVAFEQRYLLPDSLLDDSPADIPIGNGRVYHPRNYDHMFHGLVSAGEALGSSINVPAVRVLGLVGVAAVLERMRDLGFAELEADDFYGPSLALGAVDVSLWELVHGYRQFAIGGSAFTDATRQTMFDVLAAPEYRRFTFGMDSLLTLPFAAAVKTGTSKDMRDNWCIGWTDRYVVGVWVGNFNGAPMFNVSGMSGAAPVWRRLMLVLHAETASPARATAAVTATANSVATPRGKYLPAAPALAVSERTLTRIRYPAADMAVGLDPDIPEHLQQLPIEVENPQHAQLIYIDEEWLGPAAPTTFWPIARGQHRIELRTARGRVVDSVAFEVR